MKFISTFIIALFLTLGLSAQARFEFAPSVGLSTRKTSFQRQAWGTTLYGSSANFRFIADFHRVQLGGGISFHSVATDLPSSFETNSWYLHQHYYVPYFLFNYKFAKLNKSYYYAGAVVGLNIEEDAQYPETYEMQGMVGASLGWVAKLGEHVDIEISETYNVVPNGTKTWKPYYEWLAGATIPTVGRATVHTLTTNIGVRLHR